ncbi:MAG: class I SAM-dependent methyltransferase, partial [Chloroflexi bacterium]|nr:class I SAM-dependent methyltransferase [Chloroflexota bacterium]
MFFDENEARVDLEDYRANGPQKETRMLLDAILARGVEEKTLLDIGGGVGAIQHALLNAGAVSAVNVDASSAFLRAAKEEAERHGHADKIAFHHANFVELAPSIAPADVVTLDRVICCYHDMVALVNASAE